MIKITAGANLTRCGHNRKMRPVRTPQRIRQSITISIGRRHRTANVHTRSSVLRDTQTHSGGTEHRGAIGWCAGGAGSRT